MLNQKLVLVTLVCCSILLVSICEGEEKDDCDKCGPTRMIGCRGGRCYYKCTRRCLGKDNKFYYESLKFSLAGHR